MRTSRGRKRCTEEFKKEAVRVVKEQGLSMTQVARDLGIGNGTLNKWYYQMEENYTLNNESPEEEPKRLQKENLALRMERDLLKEATAFFAKTS